jgi:hypothetical protein
MKRLTILIIWMFIISCNKGVLIDTKKGYIDYSPFFGPNVKQKAIYYYYVKNNNTNVYIDALKPTGWESMGVYDYEYIEDILKENK